ncbi:hypothetical protein MMC27_005777 [Xylographa pallens]|nr:hypothetical protein [Xylographa pallens]
MVAMLLNLNLSLIDLDNAWSILLFGTLILLAVAVHVFVNFWRLRKIPGPLIAAFSRAWLLNTVNSGDAAQRYAATSQRYGRLVRTGPNHLLTSDPDVVKRILSVHSGYRRGPWYDFLRLDPRNSYLVTEQDHNAHQAKRHQMAAGYAGTDIVDFEPIINACIQDWITHIHVFGISTENSTVKVDLASSIQYLTTDIISYLCFGEPFGFVKQYSDVHGFLQMVESRLPIMEWLSVLTELNKLLSLLANIPLLGQRLLPQSTDKSGVGAIVGISKRVVEEHVSSRRKTKCDMLDSFLKHGVSPKEAQSEITIALVAGSDTTATALRATVLHIITNNHVYCKLRNEIMNADAVGKLSRPAKNDEAKQLPYLQACIKEALRIFPPITWPRERVTPPHGDMLLGYFVPGGTFIGIDAVGTMRNEVFGKDSDVFRPERWLHRNASDLAAMERVHELIFGHGDTRCLGIRIAQMTLNKVLTEVSTLYLEKNR